MRKIKKSVLACCLAVSFTFMTAIGLCVGVLYAPQTVGATDEGLKIVIDAGHGGIDGGVTGVQTGAKESDLNLAIAFALKQELEKTGFTVALTRKSQGGLYDTTEKGFKKRDMQKRKEIIEKESPIMVLSIHQNYYPSRAVRGAQVFYGKKNPRSKTLADILQKDLNAFYKEQGVKERKSTYGEYFMLECSSVPAVIIESGFLSSPLDEKLLLDEGFQKELAKRIADGVLSFLAEQTA